MDAQSKEEPIGVTIAAGGSIAHGTLHPDTERRTHTCSRPF